MSVNLYDNANQMARELRQSDAFVALQTAVTAIREDAQANEKFEAFKQATVRFQELQMTGQQPTEEDIQHAEEVAKAAQTDEKIVALMQAEQALSVLMNDINRIITQPLHELYDEQK